MARRRRGHKGAGKMGGKKRTTLDSPFTPAMHKGMGRGRRRGKSRY